MRQRTRVSFPAGAHSVSAQAGAGADARHVSHRVAVKKPRLPVSQQET
jgi:hypothetical protein